MEKNEFIKKVINDPKILNPEEVIGFFDLRGGDYDNHMIHIKLMKQLATADKLSEHKMQAYYKQYKLLADDKQISTLKIKEFEELFAAVNLFSVEPNWAAKGRYIKWKEEYSRITEILLNILHISLDKSKELLHTIFADKNSVLTRMEEYINSKFISISKNERQKVYFEAVRLIMKMQSPLEILCALNITSSRKTLGIRENDIPLEVSFGMKCLLSYLHNAEKGIVVVMPSPIFVLIISKLQILKASPITFVVPKSEVGIYEEHFNNTKYCGSTRNTYRFVAIDTYENKIKETKTIEDRRIIVMRINDKTKRVLSTINEYPEEGIQIVVLGEDSYVNEIVKNYDSFIINKILMLPTGIPNVAKPKQKSIISLSQSKKFDNYDIDVFGSVVVLKDPYLIAIGDKAKLTKEDLLRDSIRSLYEKNIRGETKQRQKSNIINLTNEIQIRYSYSPYEKGYQVDARTLILKEAPQGSVYKIEIQASRKRKVNIGIDEIFGWVNNVYPYSIKNTKDENGSIRSIIAAYYINQYDPKTETMTLKTAWYISPEVENMLNEEDIALLKAMMNGSLGRIYLSEITLEIIIDEIEQEYEPDKTSELIKILDTLSVLFECLRTKGIYQDNIIKTEILKSKTKNKRMQQIREAFSKSYLSKEKFLVLYERITEKIQLGEEEYLAALIKLFTGLPNNQVVALTWDNYIEIKNYNIKTLKISKQYNNALEDTVVIDEPYKIRQIPVCLELDAILGEKYIKVKERYPTDYGKRQIIKPIDYAEDVPIHQITKITKKLIDDLNLQTNFINVPTTNNNEKESDIYKYFGDFFQSNFKAYCDRYGGMVEEEINYLTGRKQHTALARNYLDFGSDGAQLILFNKIRRFTNVVFNRELNTMMKVVIDVVDVSKTTVKISSTYGFEVNIMKEGRE